MKGYEFFEVTTYSDEVRVFRSDDGFIKCYKPFDALTPSDIDENDKYSMVFAENVEKINKSSRKKWITRGLTFGSLISIIIILFYICNL